MKNKISIKRMISALLAMVFFIICIGISPAYGEMSEKSVFDTKTSGDISSVGNITISPNITSGEVYMEAKVKFSATDYTTDLFRVRHNNNGSYGAYTPVIIKFENGKAYARNNYNAVTEIAGFTYSADTWYTVKVKFTMGGQWGPTYAVWIDDGAGEKQYVWNNIVTGGTNFTNIGRVDFVAAESTPFEYIKGYRLVDENLPMVFMTSPTANQSFVYGEDEILLSADATLDGGSITKVEFYTDTTLIGETTVSPYKYIWTNAAVGKHTVTAKAYSSAGATGTSPAVNINVTEPNARPVVSITAPAEYSVFAPGSDIEIYASASDADGSVAKVEFYLGAEKLGEKTAPNLGNVYTYFIDNAQEGSYVITAIATDNKGSVGAAKTIRIEVGNSSIIEEQWYKYDFNDYTAAMGTTAPKKFGAWVISDGKMGSVVAPDRSEWGNCIKLTSGFGAQIGLPDPKPSSGIIVSEGDFRFEGFGVKRTILHPRYTSSAATIAQVLSTSANEFVTKGGNFIETPTGYKFKENKWYHIRTFTDLDNHTYALEINDETILKMSTISYGELFNSVAVVGLGQETGNGSVYIDNLKVSRRAAPLVNVSVSKPYSNQIVQAGTSVEFEALAAATDGSIAKVEYYNGTTLLGEATVAPYKFIWENVPAGVFSITAKAYSSGGVSGISNAVSLNSKTVVVPSVFASNMILQQNMPIKVWGTGVDGNTVSVSFNGVQRQCGVSGGKWNVEFEPIAADGETVYTMSFSDNASFSEELTNIMMGEVWVCGGQSNMERSMYSDAESVTEMANANYPKIRLFTQDANPSATLQIDVKNGAWKVCSPSTVGAFTAVGYYFGKNVHVSQNIPVGLIMSAVGGTQAASWISDNALSSNSALSYYKAGTATQVGNRLQNGLYNGMIYPIMPLGIKGVIWYQGESDASVGLTYEEALKTLIKSWRSEWGNEDIAFYIVQIPNYNEKNEYNKWYLVRESQARVVKTLNNVKMAVTLDVGDSNDLHPLYKKPVGTRLALLARKYTYNENLDIYESPQYKSMEKIGNKLIIDFDYKGSGLKTSDSLAPTGFKICGDDGVYYDADAVIEDDKVTLSSGSVADPMAVQYAYENDPKVNLYNSGDLPAAPFTATYTAPATGLIVSDMKVVYKDSAGNVTDSLASGGNVELSATITNNTGSDKNGVAVILALYKDYRVEKVNADKSDIANGASKDFTAVVTVPNDTTGISVGAFVWRSLADICPLITALK